MYLLIFLWFKFEWELGEVSVIKYKWEEFKNKGVVSCIKFCRDIKISIEEKLLDIVIRLLVIFKSSFERILEVRLYLVEV